MSIEEEIKGRFRNEYHKGYINLTYTVNHLSSQFLHLLKKHTLTEQQYNILRVLRDYRSKESVSIGFIKERMLDKNSDVSRIIDNLFAKYLVFRKENKKDRRQKDVEITEKGLSLLKEIDSYELKVDSLLKNLSLKEVEELNILLDKIRE